MLLGGKGSIKAAILGMTLGTGKPHVLRAALESIAYQVNDLVKAMTTQAGIKLKEIRVDGGPTKNKFLMQFQADILQTPIERAQMEETTALGAAFLAGLAVGFWNDQEELKELSKLGDEFMPLMKRENAEQLYQGWQRAIKAAQFFSHGE